VLMGAAASRVWLGGGVSGWAAGRRERVRKIAILGAVLALAADVAVLWLEAAAMAEVPPLQAAGAVWTLLTATHLGRAWSIGMAGLAVATAATCSRAARNSRPVALTLLSLAVFWYTRSLASHAASDGDVSLRLLADWVHLNLTGLWVGAVLVAGAIALKPVGRMSPADRHARVAYVASLSNAATIALAGIAATGLYAAWRGLGAWDRLLGNAYGNTLAIKVALVGVAAALGGFNRFVVMPAWRARASAGDPSDGLLPARFRRVLWIESLVLLAVVVLAAWLAATPPGESIE